MIRRLVVIASVGGIVALGVVAIFVIAQTAPRTAPEPVETPATRVVVRTIEYEPAQVTVRSQGEVRPRTEIDLTAQVSGEIVFVAPSFENGGSFAEGDELIRIEDADYRLAVTRAEAQVAQAGQALAQEEAESALARREWEELGRPGEASPLTLRVPQLNKARADYAAARADLRVAQLNLERTSVTAPFDGRIREKRADLSQYVNVGAPVARVFATDVAQVRLPLTDAELALVNLPLAFVATEERRGPEVVFEASLAGEARRWIGRIARTDAAFDPATRQLFAIAELQDPYGEGADDGVPMPFGLFVEAKIAGREIAEAVVIPRTAIRSGQRVYIVEDGALAFSEVEVTGLDEDRVIVRAGLKAGDRLVTSIMRSAFEGMAVEAYDPDAPGSERDPAAGAESQAATASPGGSPL